MTEIVASNEPIDQPATQQELLDLLAALTTTRRALLIIGESRMLELTQPERGQIIAALKADYGLTDEDIRRKVWGA